jgi:hypothetical protein
MERYLPDYENWPAHVRAWFDARMQEAVARYGADVPTEAVAAIAAAVPPDVREYLLAQVARARAAFAELHNGHGIEEGA